MKRRTTNAERRTLKVPALGVQRSAFVVQRFPMTISERMDLARQLSRGANASVPTA
jgi:hypothetical protein